VGLLAGFSGSGYVWSVRPRIPVPVEWILDTEHGAALAKGAWWNLS
jgi:hypothetical protein